MRGGAAGGRAGARSTRPLDSALRARARPSCTPPSAPGRLAGPHALRGRARPLRRPGPRVRAPGALPPRPAGARRLPLPLQLAAAAGIVFVVAEAGRALREPGPGSPGRAPPPPPAQRPRLRGAASAPIFRRASVTRLRRLRRRRGPEREAPGTGARRPPSPPWKRWDPVRSALRPGPGPGAREGGRSCGGDCRCPAAARGDPDAGCQAPGRDPMPSSPGGGDRAPAEDTGSLLDPCGGGLRDGAQELTRVRRGRADRTRPRSSVRGRLRPVGASKGTVCLVQAEAWPKPGPRVFLAWGRTPFFLSDDEERDPFTPFLTAKAEMSILFPWP